VFLHLIPAHYLEHVNSLTSPCGVPLDVSTGSVFIRDAITLSWKVGKGIIKLYYCTIYMGLVQTQMEAEVGELY